MIPKRVFTDDAQASGRTAKSPVRVLEGGQMSPLSVFAEDAVGPTADLAAQTIVSIQGVSCFYGSKKAVKDVSIEIPEKQVTAFIGPSGCGKSTLLRCLNRMNDLVDVFRLEGQVLIGGMDIYTPTTDVTELRKRVGMVFQKSNPFPKSIYENVAYGMRIHGMKSGPELDEIVERSLRGAALWDEIKDRLKDSALGLSGGQQQRLCIARAIAVSPKILLMDEPCSALDPIATGKIEELIYELKNNFTIVIVTHNMQQAARISEQTGFMLQGELIEFGDTRKLFQNPDDKRTEDYIRGRFG